MRNQLFRAGLVLIASLSLAGFVAACGGGETTTSTETSTVTEGQETPTTTTPATTTSTAATSTSATSTTPGPTTTPASQTCSNGQVYSQSSGACVDPNPSGNPCPEGEVPMADEPVCVPKD
jgi:hypothetical protein